MSEEATRDEIEALDAVLLGQEGTVEEGAWSAKIVLTLDVSFLETMRKDNGLTSLMSTCKDPLILSVSHGDVIDVEMLLEDLRVTKGSQYFAEVLNNTSNDDEATALHVAAHASKGEIVKTLMECYRENSNLQLSAQLDRISDERSRSVAEIMMDASEDYGMTTKLEFRDPRIVAIDDWFDEAGRRAHRVHEFRQEIWWAKCLSARDRQGRTPLHYAVLGGNMSTLEALLGSGHGHFRDKKAMQWFEESALYSTTSGHVVGTVHGGTTRPLEELPVAEASFNLQRAALSSASWDLASSKRPDCDASGKRSAYTSSLDFEVIVPWVLRNMLKRAQDLGSKRDMDASQQLRVLAERACVDGGGHTLIASELRAVLQRLGIRLTADVIRELCRQYPGDSEVISDKWGRYVKRMGLESHKADSKGGSGSGRRGDDSDDEGMAGAKDGLRGRDEPSESKGADRDSRSSGSKGGSGGDDSGGDNKEGSGTGTGTGSGSDDGKNKKEEQGGGSEVDNEEDDLGLDVEQLLAAMTDGKALVTLHLGDDDGMGDANSSAARRVQNQLSVPACVSIGALFKARVNALNLVDQYGCSPLLYASSLGKDKMVDLLCRHGADVGISSRDGLSAFSVAATKGISSRLETSLVTWLRASKSDGESDVQAGKLLQSLGKENDASKRERLISGMTEYFPQLQAQHWSYSMPSLSWSVVSSAPSVLKDMLTGTQDVNEGDLTGRTPLHECVSLLSKFDKSSGAGKSTAEALQMLEALLNANADANRQTISGRSPLHELFCRGQNDAASSSSHGGVKVTTLTRIPHRDEFDRARVAAVQLLLHWGADPLLPDRHGNTPLHHAARMNEKRCITYMLLSLSKASGDTGLSSSVDAEADAKGGKPVPTEYVRNPHGRTCMHMACQAGAAEAAHLLARWDADTPLVSFAAQQDKQLLRPVQLLPPSVNANCLDTSWGLARAGDFKQLGQYLNRVKDASLNGGTEDDGAGGSGGRTQATVNPWLDDSVDCKSRRLKWTPLHCCVVGWAEARFASKGNNGSAKSRALGLTLTKKVVKLGNSSTRMKNNSYARLATDKTGAGDSSNNAFKGTMAVLLQHKAYADCLDWQCRTPLMMAASADLPHNALEALVTAGAELDCKDLDGNTALHYAYAYGSMGASVWLEAKGASTDVKNLQDYTPFELVGNMGRIQPPVFATQRFSVHGSSGDAKDDDDAKDESKE
jgi:ankyrin repeat protein